MNMFIFKVLRRTLLTLGLAAGIAVGCAAAYAWGAVELFDPGASGPSRRDTVLALLPIGILSASIAAAGGIYVGLRIAWQRPGRRDPRGWRLGIQVAIPLLLLPMAAWILVPLAPLLATSGGLSALAAAKLLGPGSFPLTPRSWSA